MRTLQTLSVQITDHMYHRHAPQLQSFVSLQIEHLEAHQEWGQALQLLRRLCTAPQNLTPSPRGLSAGLTGRPSAWHALSMLQKIPDGAAAAQLAVQHMHDWLLDVRVPRFWVFVCSGFTSMAPCSLLRSSSS